MDLGILFLAFIVIWLLDSAKRTNEAILQEIKELRKQIGWTFTPTEFDSSRGYPKDISETLERIEKTLKNQSR